MFQVVHPYLASIESKQQVYLVSLLKLGSRMRPYGRFMFGIERKQKRCNADWWTGILAGAHPGHVGVPGGDEVVGHAIHGTRQVLQRLGAHQPVRKVHNVQERRHCRHKRAVVVRHRLLHSICKHLSAHHLKEDFRLQQAAARTLVIKAHQS